jgi:hypothetical protein
MDTRTSGRVGRKRSSLRHQTVSLRRGVWLSRLRHLGLSTLLALSVISAHIRSILSESRHSQPSTNPRICAIIWLWRVAEIRIVKSTSKCYRDDPAHPFGRFTNFAKSISPACRPTTCLRMSLFLPSREDIAGHDHQKLELMDREQHLQCDDPGHGNAPGRTVPHGLQELAGAIILETKGLLAGTIPNGLRVHI